MWMLSGSFFFYYYYFFRGGELRLLRGKTERIRTQPSSLNPECSSPLVAKSSDPNDDL